MGMSAMSGCEKVMDDATNWKPGASRDLPPQKIPNAEIFCLTIMPLVLIAIMSYNSHFTQITVTAFAKWQHRIYICTCRRLTVVSDDVRWLARNAVFVVNALSVTLTVTSVHSVFTVNAVNVRHNPVRKWFTSDWV